MSDSSKPPPEPKVIRAIGRYRLVHHVRDQKRWPDISDLTLEEISLDAMGGERWVYVYSWCLSFRYRDDPPKSESEYAGIALKMLVDPSHHLTKAR